MRTNKIATTLVVTAALLLCPRDAAAYIDPGTGSLAYQALLAMALGVGFAFRSARARAAQVLDQIRQRIAGRPRP